MQQYGPTVPYKDPAKNREAVRRFYYANYDSERKRIAATKVKQKDRNADYVRSIKQSTACADCQISYPYYVMQFDHLGVEDKDRAVSQMVYAPVGLAKLQSEIAKCEVVCANCHAERTHRRRQAAIGA